MEQQKLVLSSLLSGGWWNKVNKAWTAGAINSQRKRYGYTDRWIPDLLLVIYLDLMADQGHNLLSARVGLIS